MRFNTQPPEGGWKQLEQQKHVTNVSTHSRLKAAGSSSARFWNRSDCFNTQPPEGGWPQFDGMEFAADAVSTHSRLKAAGLASELLADDWKMFQHTAA